MWRPTYLELRLTPLAGTAGPLDLQLGFSAGVLDGEPGVRQGDILVDVADDGARRGLHLDVLEAAEAQARGAAQGTF